MVRVDETSVLSPRLYAHVALVFYVLGLLTRDGLKLRIWLLFGTVFYILYYIYVATEPLWDAIFASLVIGAANLWSMGAILLDRSTLGLSERERDLFTRFPTLNPGQFRRMMKGAAWHRAEERRVLTTRGEVPTALFFVLQGPVTLSRGGRVSDIPGGQFIGELSFMRGEPASATAEVQPGAEYVAWDRAHLTRLMQGNAAMANALGALFNRDLAEKLAVSWPESPVLQEAPAQ